MVENPGGWYSETMKRSCCPAHAAIVRLLRLLAITVLLTGGTAGASIKSERLLAAIFTHTPAPLIVTPGVQFEVAEQAAAQIPGAFTLCGFGASMEPLYRPKTAVVVAPVDFKALQKGMTVVYRSRRGHLVAHSLTGDLPKGWIAQGINNETEDHELVTQGNLVGVIVAAYAEGHTDYRLAVTAQLTAKGRLAMAE